MISMDVVETKDHRKERPMVRDLKRWSKEKLDSGENLVLVGTP